MLTTNEFATGIGFEKMPAPGQVDFQYHVGEKEGTSYTIRLDNRDPKTPKVETLAGLMGKPLDAVELREYSVWLQSANAVELKIEDDKVTDVRGKLLGKEVAGAEVIEKVQGFFGSLAQGAINKAQEYALAAVKITKEILPTLGRIPFANEFTGRSLAFAKAAGTSAHKAAPKIALAPSAPSLGLGGGSRAARRVVVREEDRAEE
jgi:hypothetical protein